MINLMQDLQEELGLTYVFIGHDLSVVEHISHHIAVMYLGTLGELGDATDPYHNPIPPTLARCSGWLRSSDPRLTR